MEREIAKLPSNELYWVTHGGTLACSQQKTLPHGAWQLRWDETVLQGP